MYTRKLQDQRRRTMFPRYTIQVRPPEGTTEAIARSRSRAAAIMYAQRHHGIYGWPAFVRDSLNGEEVFRIERAAQERAQ